MTQPSESVSRRFFIRSIRMWYTIEQFPDDPYAFWVGTIIPGDNDRHGNSTPLEPGSDDEVVADLVDRDKIYAAVGIIPSDAARSGLNQLWRGINSVLSNIKPNLSLDRATGRATITRVMYHIDDPQGRT